MNTMNYNNFDQDNRNNGFEQTPYPVNNALNAQPQAEHSRH
ncbi:hypothetical protein [uncultured Ruminococcus sp.]|nr:hypothetical protein [uncultured Ruminococcus sp.]